MFRQTVLSKYKIIANTTTYYHGSPTDHGPILKVQPLGSSIAKGGDNIFGGVFLSKSPIGHIGPSKNYWYGIDLADNDILSVGSIYYDVDVDDIKKVLDNYVSSTPDEDDLDFFVDILSDKYHPSDENKAQDLFVNYGIVSLSEAHSWGWYQQSIQGQIAKKLGYKAAEMKDERTTVYLLVGPAELTKIKDEDLPDS
jgi:hypothetical protein